MIGPREWSIRATLLAMIALATIPPIAIGLSQIRTAGNVGRALLTEQLDRELTEIAGTVRARWQYRHGNLLLLATNDVARAALTRSTPSAIDVAFLRDLAARSDGIERAVLAGRARAPLVIIGAGDAAPDAGGVDPSRSGVLPVTLPIMGDDGAPLGELRASVSLAFILPADTRRSNVPPLLSVFDSAGRSPLATPAVPSDLLGGDTFDWNDQRWLVRRRLLTMPALSLILAAPLEPFVGPFQRAAAQRAGVLVIGSMVAILLAGLLASRLSRSVQRLVVAADEVAQGHLDKQIAGNGTTEFGRLARAFNAMTAALGVTLRRLAERESLAAVGEFAASLAHEIRNPLTAIRVDLQHLARRGKPDRAEREALDRALRQVDRLDRTVSAALELARGNEVRLQRVALDPIVRDAIAAAEPEAVQRGARIFNAAQLPALHVLADAAALHQVLLNLVLNAAQAVEPGGAVRVTSGVYHNGIVVTIRDDGRGIPAAHLKRIFDPFYTTRAGGTGLGLAVARRIALAHGGDIAIESTEGIGTTATLSLRSA